MTSKYQISLQGITLVDSAAETSLRPFGPVNYLDKTPIVVKS